MKLLQSKTQCLQSNRITVDHIRNYPSASYPNSETYCYHDFYEWELFAAGCGTHEINGIPYEVRKGYFYLITPGDFHRIHLQSHEIFELYNVKTALDVPSADIAQKLLEFPKPISVYLDSEQFDMMEKELLLLDECCHHGKWNAEMQKTAVDRMLAVLLDALSQNRILPHIENVSKIRPALDYIGAHYREEISLSVLANCLQLSESYVGSFFRRQTGMRVKEYVRRLRLFHAANLLVQTNMNIKEISYRVGFSSPEYMARLFEEAFHVSPSAYRKKPVYIR